MVQPIDKPETTKPPIDAKVTVDTSPLTQYAGSFTDRLAQFVMRHTRPKEGVVRPGLLAMDPRQMPSAEVGLKAFLAHYVEEASIPDAMADLAKFPVEDRAHALADLVLAQAPDLYNVTTGDSVMFVRDLTAQAILRNFDEVPFAEGAEEVESAGISASNEANELLGKHVQLVNWRLQIHGTYLRPLVHDAQIQSEVGNEFADPAPAAPAIGMAESPAKKLGRSEIDFGRAQAQYAYDLVTWENANAQLVGEQLTETLKHCYEHTAGTTGFMTSTLPGARPAIENRRLALVEVSRTARDQLNDLNAYAEVRSEQLSAMLGAGQHREQLGQHRLSEGRPLEQPAALWTSAQQHMQEAHDLQNTPLHLVPAVNEEPDYLAAVPDETLRERVHRFVSSASPKAIAAGPATPSEAAAATVPGHVTGRRGHQAPDSRGR